MIAYRLFEENFLQHRLGVNICWQATSNKALFEMPAWTPGSYLLREYVKNITHVHVKVNNVEWPCHKRNKSTWEIENLTAGDKVEVSLIHYAHDVSVRVAFVDANACLLNLASILPWVHGHEHTAQTLTIPRFRPNWQCATALDADTLDSDGFGVYHADTFEALIDHPVFCGALTTLQFQVRGVPHAIALLSDSQCNMYRLKDDTQKIVNTHLTLFHGDMGLPPYRRYVFLIHAVANGFGGLEHRSSTRLLCSRNDLPRVNEASDRPAYVRLLGLISHEYFHTWNVKRLKPLAFTPYQLHQENYTRSLWMFEGFTSYYDDLGLVRAGLISEATYLRLWSEVLSRWKRTPGRLVQSIADSSFDTWVKYYRPDEDAVNSQISYYTGGALVALCIDAHLRSLGHTLDQLMLVLWDKYASNGMPENAVLCALEELSQVSWREYFEKYINQANEPPLVEAFAQLGYKLNWRVSKNQDDLSGPSPHSQSQPEFTWHHLGVVLSDKAIVQRVLMGQSASLAGVNVGDEIIALHTARLQGNKCEALSKLMSGDTVAVVIARDGILHNLSLTVMPPISDTAHLALNPEDATSAIAWLMLSPDN